ncbi:MAG: hypothetical protein ACJA1C_000098 [Crocinitomicaceae bacterium]|jgi:hypothetical protein
MANELVSMAQQFSGLPMDALIGGPLNAASKANAAMALTQTKFMLDTCFSKTVITPAAGKTPAVYNYKPIMIKMSLTRGVIKDNGDGKDPTIVPMVTKFDLPLITIVPINSLGVDDVTVTFEMEVKSSFSEENEQKSETAISAETSFEVKVGWGPVSASVRGSASYDHKDSSTHSTHYQKSNSAKYTVSVHAGQLPIPKGVNTIIEAFTKAIEPIELKSTAPAAAPTTP